MAKSQIKEQQDKYLQALENRGEAVGLQEHVPDIRWTKKKGVAKCLFCEEEIKYYAFVCPDGRAVACSLCKHKLSRFTPPKLEGYDTDHEAPDEETKGI